MNIEKLNEVVRNHRDDWIPSGKLAEALGVTSVALGRELSTHGIKATRKTVKGRKVSLYIMSDLAELSGQDASTGQDTQGGQDRSGQDRSGQDESGQDTSGQDAVINPVSSKMETTATTPVPRNLSGLMKYAKFRKVEFTVRDGKLLIENIPEELVEDLESKKEAIITFLSYDRSMPAQSQITDCRHAVGKLGCMSPEYKIVGDKYQEDCQNCEGYST